MIIELVIICDKYGFNVACLLGETALSPWVKAAGDSFGIALLGNFLCRFCFHEENAYQATSDLQLTLLLLRLFIGVAEGSGVVRRRTSKLYLATKSLSQLVSRLSLSVVNDHELLFLYFTSGYWLWL